MPTSAHSASLPPPSGETAVPPDARGPFQAGVALVSAALDALRDMPRAIEAMAATAADGNGRALAEAVDALEAAIARAGTVDRRNLLVRAAGAGDTPFLVFGLARRPCGAVHVQPIEIDLASIVLVAPPEGTLDRLRSAIEAARAGTGDPARPEPMALVRARLAALLERVRAATSRLSIVKARLDLQGTYLASMLAPGGAAAPTPLASDLDQAAARSLALDTRRALGGRGLTTGGLATGGLATGGLTTGGLASHRLTSDAGPSDHPPRRAPDHLPTPGL